MRSVLDAGCGTGRVAIELHRRGIDVVGADLDDDMLALARAKAPDVPWAHVDLATMQLDRRFGIVAMPGNVMLFCRDVDRRAVVHSCVQHLQPDGLLVAGFSCDRSTGPGRVRRVVRRLRPDAGRSLVHLGASALRDWRRLRRVGASTQLPIQRARPAVRSPSQHRSMHSRRTARTAWRAPIRRWSSIPGRRPIGSASASSPARSTCHAPCSSGISTPPTDIAIRRSSPSTSRWSSCATAGYSSSLGAANLVALGFTAVVDLVGGMHAWIESGGSVEVPDHSHLDL